MQQCAQTCRPALGPLATLRPALLQRPAAAIPGQQRSQTLRSQQQSRRGLATKSIVIAAASQLPVPQQEPSSVDDVLPDVGEVARQNLKKAANACRRYGWMAFWAQLVLSTIASVIMLFSMAFTAQNGPPISLYLTLFSIILSFLSTFWSFGYTRLSNRLRSFLEAPSLDVAPKVKRSDVINMLEKGAIINVLGAGAAMIALQATIGLLVAKTLTSATVNPFLASTTSSWNPVLAFDVFNVQATTNALLSHFFSLVSSLWLLRVIANRPSATSVVSKGTRTAAA